MGKDKRQWRKLVKKLRRSRIRQSKAEEAKIGNKVIADDDDSDEEGEGPIADLLEEKRWHDLEEEAWLERERQSNLVFQAKKRKAEELALAAATEKERIRLEWEEKQKIEAQEKAELELVAKQKQEKQVKGGAILFKDEEFNQLLEFLSGDIETPPLPYLMPTHTAEEDDDPCLYFSRTGACRFYEKCKKSHPSPALSSTILIANFFTHISLEQIYLDDIDFGLEFEETDLRKDFLSFYDDVLSEFRKSGTVIQFKVCRNFEPHLRGNVYVQYKNIQDSVHAYRKFNGRFYNGKQLTLRFVKLVSWRNAICGQFNRGTCLKGKACNYLHVFRDPTREFVSADRDWDAAMSFRIDSSTRLQKSQHSSPTRRNADFVPRHGHDISSCRHRDRKVTRSKKSRFSERSETSHRKSDREERQGIRDRHSRSMSKKRSRKRSRSSDSRNKKESVISSASSEKRSRSRSSEAFRKPSTKKRSQREKSCSDNDKRRERSHSRKSSSSKKHKKKKKKKHKRNKID